MTARAHSEKISATQGLAFEGPLQFRLNRPILMRDNVRFSDGGVRRVKGFFKSN